MVTVTNFHRRSTKLTVSVTPPCSWLFSHNSTTYFISYINQWNHALKFQWSNLWQWHETKTATRDKHIWPIYYRTHITGELRGWLTFPTVSWCLSDSSYSQEKQATAGPNPCPMTWATHPIVWTHPSSLTLLRIKEALILRPEDIFQSGNSKACSLMFFLFSWRALGITHELNDLH